MAVISCTPFQRKILLCVKKSDVGISAERLRSKFGEESLQAADDLYCDGYLERKSTQEDLQVSHDSKMPILGFESGNFEISRSGKLLLRECKELQILTLKEKWLERIWGFLTGVVLTIFAWKLSGL